MKYRLLLKFLRLLMYIKRLFWKIGAGIYLFLAKIFGFLTRGIIYLQYKTGYFFKKAGIDKRGEWLLKRGFLQTLLFLAFFSMILSQTTLLPRANLAEAAQHTEANQLVGAEEEVPLEEVTDVGPILTDQSAWRVGTIESEIKANVDESATDNLATEDVVAIVAGGNAIQNPIILPGATAGTKRTDVVEYTVEPGDSINAIAYQFGVSAQTILWENNLTAKTLLKPGQVLRIPPASGVMHTVAKGDTLKKIAALYDANAAEIVAFNHLNPDGTDLVKGENIFIPNGTKPAPVVAVQPTSKAPTGTGPHGAKITASPIASGISTLPNSIAAATDAGFIWPSGSHTVTQYFNPNHHAMDIAGPWQTPTYAAKGGVVEKAQCGWNGGYGCYVIIDHGNGIKTLYGHHSVLLVQPGDVVQQGQVIALMGNTGNVRGITGIHLHFEVIVNGVRVNPLGYIR